MVSILLLSIPSHSVSASVGSMDMTGVPHGSCPTSLLSSQVGGATAPAVDAPLLKFGLELNPLDRPEMDVVVRAELRPIKITYDAVSELCVLVYLCMCVCVSMCVGVCMCVCVNVYVGLVYMCVICMCVLICVCPFLHVSVPYVCTCTIYLLCVSDLTRIVFLSAGDGGWPDRSLQTAKEYPPSRVCCCLQSFIPLHHPFFPPPPSWNPLVFPFPSPSLPCPPLPSALSSLLPFLSSPPLPSPLLHSG